MKPKAIVYEVETRGKSCERSFDLSKPDEQIFLYKTNPSAFIMSSRFEGIEQILDDLGLPNFLATEYYSRIFRGLESFNNKKPYDKRYKKYPIEIFGRRVPADGLSYLFPEYQPLPDSSGYITPKYLYERHYFLIEIWRIRIFSRHVRSLQISLSNPVSPRYPDVLYLEERWHPERGPKIYIGGLEEMSGPEVSLDLKSFTMDALKILGRARGPGKPREVYRKFKDRGDFKRQVLSAYSQLKSKKKPRPSKSAVARFMGITFDTLEQYLDDFSVSWPPKESKD